MSERIATRREMLRITAITAISAGLAACTGETEAQKLERLNSPLAEQIATWMGITPNTTPEEYSKLCVVKSVDLNFIANTNSIGSIVGLDGRQLQVAFSQQGGKLYSTTPDLTNYIHPNPLEHFETVSNTNSNNKLVYIGTLFGTKRMEENENILKECVTSYLSGKKIPYSLVIIGMPGNEDLSEFGIQLEKKPDGTKHVPEGVTISKFEKQSLEIYEAKVVIFLENIHRTSKELGVPLSAGLAETLANEYVHLQEIEYSGKSFAPEFETYNERYSTLAGILSMISPKYRPLLLGGEFSDQLNFIAKEMERSVIK